MTNLVEEAQEREIHGEVDLTFEFSDEALEAAADVAHGAYSLVGAPTVSILVACCSS